MISARIGIFGLVCGLTSACTPLDSVGNSEVDAATGEATEPTDAARNDAGDAARPRSEEAKDHADASQDGSREAAQPREDIKEQDASDRTGMNSSQPDAAFDGASASGPSSPAAPGGDAEAVKSPQQDGGSGGPAPVCTPEEAKCEDLIPMHCSDAGQWTQEAPCPFACEAGECVGVCTPDSKQCAADNKTRQTCDNKGNWVSDEECPDACHEGRCTECAPANPPPCYQGTLRAAICSSQGVLSPGLASPACGACRQEDTGCDFTTHEYKTCKADGTLERQVTVDCGATCTPGKTACKMLTEPTLLDCQTDGCFAGWTEPGNVSVARCSSAGEWVTEQSCDATTCTVNYMGTTVNAHYCRISGGTARCHSGGACPQ